MRRSLPPIETSSNLQLKESSFQFNFNYNNNNTTLNYNNNNNNTPTNNTPTNKNNNNNNNSYGNNNSNISNYTRQNSFKYSLNSNLNNYGYNNNNNNHSNYNSPINNNSKNKNNLNNLSPSLSPLNYKPQLLLEDYKIFWRVYKTCLISIYYHFNCNSFEVVTYTVKQQQKESEENEKESDEQEKEKKEIERELKLCQKTLSKHSSLCHQEYNFQDGEEEKRLYVSLTTIIPLLENKSEIQMIKLLRWDLYDRSIRKCAAEYIFGILECDLIEGLRLTRFDARENILLHLDTEKPHNLTPVTVERMSSVSQTEIFHDAISEISEASHYSSSASEYAQDILVTTESQLEQLSSLHRQYDTEEAINPNKFSTARWRWVWVIDKVLISIRVNKCILAIWKSANKGRLVYQTMSSSDHKGMADHGRAPLFNSFRKYSTLLSSRLNPDKNLISCQPPVSAFQEMISSFEESKQKAQERRKIKNANKRV